MEHLIVSRECGPQFFQDLIKEGYSLDDDEKKGKLKESRSIPSRIIRDIEHQIDEGHSYDNFMDADDLEDYIWSEVDYNMPEASEGEKSMIAQLIFDELEEDGYLDKLAESYEAPEAKRIRENILVAPGKPTSRGKDPQQGLIVDGMRLNESRRSLRESRIREANKNYPLLKDIFSNRLK